MTLRHVYRVTVILTNGQRWWPLVAATTPEYAKARALGMGVGGARVAKVEGVVAAE